MADQSATATAGARIVNRTNFNTEYLPGYTGHIPYKKEIYGRTLGDINRIVKGDTNNKSSPFIVDNNNGHMTQGVDIHGTRTFYSKPPLPNNDSITIQYGNASRKGEFWIGGPTQNAKA